MRRTLIILAFLYFSIDSVFFLINSGWPFTLPQWILVFMIIGMTAFAIYQWKLMIKEEKEKKEALKEEEERLKQLETEQESVFEESDDQNSDEIIPEETGSRFDE